MKNVFRAMALCIVLIATLSACGTGGEAVVPPTETPAGLPVVPEPTKDKEALATVVVSDLCANQYFPIQSGSHWAYSSTGSPVGPYEFLQRVKDIRPDGFTIRSALKKVPTPQDWTCKPEGLAPVSLIINDAASILAFQKYDSISISNMNGVAIPKDITPGMQWTYTFDVAGTQNGDAGAIASMTGNISYAYTAGNIESVTVQAGTYDAIAVQVTSTIRIKVASAEGETELVLESNYTYWYAAGVGLVKMSGSGKIGGQDYFETIELIGHGTKQN